MKEFELNPLSSIDVVQEQDNFSAILEGRPFKSLPGISFGPIDTGMLLPPEGALPEGAVGVEGIHVIFEKGTVADIQSHDPTPDTRWLKKVAPLLSSVIDAERQLADSHLLHLFVRMMHWNNVPFDAYLKHYSVTGNGNLPHLDAETVLGDGQTTYLTTNWMVATSLGMAQYQQAHSGIGENTFGYNALNSHCARHTVSDPTFVDDSELVRFTGVHSIQRPDATVDTSSEIPVINRTVFRAKFATTKTPYISGEY